MHIVFLWRLVIKMKKYIKLFEEFINESMQYTGKEVARYVKDITPDDSDIPKYFIKKYIRPNDGWVIRMVKIKDLLKSDPDVKEYVDSGIDRYEDDPDIYYEPAEDELYNPIVVHKGEVLDGYSRIAKLHSMGIKEVEAYVLDKY